MKKIITVCLLLLTVCLLTTGIAAADTFTGGQTFYIANENITVYVNTDGTPQPAFIIPKSYYFRTLQNNGEYTSIVYNNTDPAYSFVLYIKTSDLETKSSITEDKVTDKEAFFDLSFTIENTAAPYYKPGNFSSSPTTSEFVKYCDFLGVYQFDGVVYFAVVVESTSNYSVMLIKASDTSKTTFSLASIPLHQITIDKNNAANEGVISTPGNGNNDITGNNVIRNVMIAVICVMCVLVIFLIFRPTKNAKNRYEMENRERVDDNYDNNGYGSRN